MVTEKKKKLYPLLLFSQQNKFHLKKKPKTMKEKKKVGKYFCVLEVRGFLCLTKRRKSKRQQT